jgi:VTC domain
VSYRLDRFEMKFVISRPQRDALMPRLLPHLRADVNAGDDAFYPIISLYYDNEDRDCYWEKLRGQGSRRKMRVRVYGSLDGKLPPTSFIEVKHKCDSRVVKRRAQMPLEDALKVGAGEKLDRPLSFSDQKVIDEVHGLVRGRGFRPHCCMRYDRQAFADVNPASDLRITFDTGIGYRMHDLTPVPDDRSFSDYLLKEGDSVMEVKVTGSVPFWLPRMLGAAGCILTSHSKYCNALAAGDPVLRKRTNGQSAHAAALTAKASVDTTSGGEAAIIPATA